MSHIKAGYFLLTLPFGIFSLFVKLGDNNIGCEKLEFTFEQKNRQVVDMTNTEFYSFAKNSTIF